MILSLFLIGKGEKYQRKCRKNKISIIITNNSQKLKLSEINIINIKERREGDFGWRKK